MADNEKSKTVWSRVIVRVHLPKVDTRHVAAIHARIEDAVKEYDKAEIELSMLPLMPTR